MRCLDVEPFQLSETTRDSITLSPAVEILSTDAAVTTGGHRFDIQSSDDDCGPSFVVKTAIATRDRNALSAQFRVYRDLENIDGVPKLMGLFVQDIPTSTPGNGDMRAFLLVLENAGTPFNLDDIPTDIVYASARFSSLDIN